MLHQMFLLNEPSSQEAFLEIDATDSGSHAFGIQQSLRSFLLH